MLFKIGQKVLLKDVYGSNHSRGKIVGGGHIHKADELMALYIIELDKGFYDPDKSVYVSLLLVHPDNMVAA